MASPLIRTVLTILVLLSAALAWFVFAAEGSQPLTPTTGVAASPASVGAAEQKANVERADQLGERHATRTTRLGRTIHVMGRVTDTFDLPVAGATVSLVTRLTRAGRPTTDTATDGTFALDVQVDRTDMIKVRLRASTFAAAQFEHRAARGDDSLDLGTLLLSQGGRIVGRVVAEHGAGIAAATTALRPSSDNRLAPAIDRDELAPHETDVTGFFSFDRLTAGRYRLDVRADGFTHASVPGHVDVIDGETRDLGEIQLDPGSSLHGTVFGATGTTISGATVSVRNTTRTGRLVWTNERTTTDADGRYRLLHLPLGVLRIDVRAADHLTWERSAVDTNTTKELDVHLEPGLVVTGIVLDETGAPVEHFASQLHRLRSLPTRSERRRRDVITQQLEAMTRRLAELAPGDSARAGLESSRRSMQSFLESSRAGLNNRYWTEEPIPSRKIPRSLGPTQHHPDGRFSYQGVDEGIYVVYVVTASHVRQASAALTIQRGTASVPVRIEVRRGMSVHGRVVNASGRPVGVAHVELRVGETDKPEQPQGTERYRLQSGALLEDTETDHGGYYRIDNCPVGRYVLTVRHDTAASTTSAPFDLVATDLELNLSMAAHANMAGKVLGIRAGTDERVSVLALTRNGSGSRKTTRAGTDGRYKIDGLEPGEYVVRAFCGAERDYLALRIESLYGPQSQSDVALHAGLTTTFDVPLDRPAIGRLEGTVRHNGSPGRGLRVTLQPAPNATRMRMPKRASCDAKGSFRFEKLLAGRYELTLSSTVSKIALYRNSIEVTVGTAAVTQIDIQSGGIRGRLVNASGPMAMNGYLRIYPGHSFEPGAEDRRARGSSLTVPIRRGRFEALAIRSGPAWVEVLGKPQSGTAASIPRGTTLELDLRIGPN